MVTKVKFSLACTEIWTLWSCRLWLTANSKDLLRRPLSSLRAAVVAGSQFHNQPWLHQSSWVAHWLPQHNQEAGQNWAPVSGLSQGFLLDILPLQDCWRLRSHFGLPARILNCCYSLLCCLSGCSCDFLHSAPGGSQSLPNLHNIRQGSNWMEKSSNDSSLLLYIFRQSNLIVKQLWRG